jgi:hypothetical protein
MMSAFSVPSCSPRTLCCLLILATAWVGPLLWLLFLEERDAVSYYVQAECTVTKTHIQRERLGGTVRYVGAWDVYWCVRCHRAVQPVPAAPARWHSAATAHRCCVQSTITDTLWACCDRTDAAQELRTGRIYGLAGDGSLVYTYRTEARATAETQSPSSGESAACVYDGRVTATDGQASEAKKGWVRWGAPETTEAVLGGWATGVSVGWLCLGLSWCALRRLERRYECSSGAEYWGVGVLCCVHTRRSSERQILMEDFGDGDTTDDDDDRQTQGAAGAAGGSGRGLAGKANDQLALGGGGAGSGQELLGGTR